MAPTVGFLALLAGAILVALAFQNRWWRLGCGLALVVYSALITPTAPTRQPTNVYLTT